MLVFFVITILNALLVAFLVGLIRKSYYASGIISRLPKLLYELCLCDFCICFWLSVVISIVVAIITGQLYFLAMPVFTTQLSKILI